MAGFQDIFVHSPIKPRGFGLGSPHWCSPPRLLSLRRWRGQSPLSLEGVCRELEHLMGPGARGAVLEGPAGLKHPHRGGVQSCLGPPTEGGSPVQHLLGPMGKELER